MDGLLHLLQQAGDWAGLRSPPHCIKCNSPPINGQCTNFILFDVAIKLTVPIKGLMVFILDNPGGPEPQLSETLTHYTTLIVLKLLTSPPHLPSQVFQSTSRV